ncbi:hypothetical protein BGZ76_001677 [Entomortierella beljakovae]|nr:hypothetical protein BGZ76_001677 [Entomortierella beljakovae]
MLDHLFITATLWSPLKYTSKRKGNEDSFCANVVRPFLTCAFGHLPGIKLRGNGDRFTCGDELDKELKFPDFSVTMECYRKSFGENYLVVAEVKPPTASQDELDNDYIKLPNLMKSALDHQIAQGYEEGTVIGILVQGWSVFVFYMTLEHEAIYELKNIGQFRLISDHTQMAQTLSICPILVEAKDLVEKTREVLRRRPASNISSKDRLRRPSYHITPIMIYQDDGNKQKGGIETKDYETSKHGSNKQEFRFSATLDGIDVAGGFQQLFNVVKRKKVHITNTDEALARSGVILLLKEGTKLQKQYLGEKTLAKIRDIALAKWQDNDVTVCRNLVRAWLDPHEDHGYDRTKSLKHISDSPPLDSKYQKIWIFLMNAVQELPESDNTKSYSESTSISSFILPLCRVFMGMPDQRVFLNFTDSTTESGRSRSGSSSRKEPDLTLEIKDRSNKTLCEVGIGEVTSHAQKGLKKKNAKDLVRVGLSLKDALDFIEDTYGVHDAVLVGWQVIGQIMAI